MLAVLIFLNTLSAGYGKYFATPN